MAQSVKCLTLDFKLRSWSQGRDIEPHVELYAQWRSLLEILSHSLHPPFTPSPSLPQINKTLKKETLRNLQKKKSKISRTNSDLARSQDIRSIQKISIVLLDISNVLLETKIQNNILFGMPEWLSWLSVWLDFGSGHDLRVSGSHGLHDQQKAF